MKILYPSLLAASFLFVGCGNKSTSNNTIENQDSTSTMAPVETKSRVTDYEPAFAGQTRIQGIKTKTPVATKVLTKDLSKPWSVKSLPDGRLLVTEKEGVMRIVSNNGVLSAPIQGIPEVDDAGQGGLLDVCLDPDFATNRMLYWTFSERVGNGNHTAVAKGKLSSDESRIENAKVIYQALPSYDGDKHYGSRIVFDGNGNLFVSTGERSDIETRPMAQSLNAALGKIVLITTDGKPVAGNPFISQSNAKPEIYSYGHRNPQGIALHPQSGVLWVTEMGPKGGDELNKISAGKNYGWPVITYGVEYSGKTIGAGITQKDGMEQPVYYWDPVTSPSGMTFYSNGNIPEWENNLFVGGLSGQHIMRIVIENDKVVAEERLLADEGERFRDITQGIDGSLYAITDSGKLYKIAKK